MLDDDTLSIPSLRALSGSTAVRGDQSQVFTIYAEQHSFMYRQVRALAGCIVNVARGAMPPEAIRTILAQKERTAKVPTAPAHGLYFVDAAYDESITESDIDNEIDYDGPLHNLSDVQQRPIHLESE